MSTSKTKVLDLKKVDASSEEGMSDAVFGEKGILFSRFQVIQGRTKYARTLVFLKSKLTHYLETASIHITRN